MKKLTLLTLFISTLFATQIASARSWTCHASIFMEGTSKVYTPPSWGMSGGAFVDREKKCKEHLERYIVNISLFKKAPFYTSNVNTQNSYCKNGATFRVEYGFDKRKKSWNFRKFVKPVCKCEPDGYK